MTDAQQIALIRKEFRGYDQSLHSKCRYPARYGIRRTEQAESIIESATPLKPIRAATRDFRRKPNKHTFWLSERQEGRLHKARIALGNGGEPATVQFTVEKALELLFGRLEGAHE